MTTAGIIRQTSYPVSCDTHHLRFNLGDQLLIQADHGKVTAIRLTDKMLYSIQPFRLAANFDFHHARILTDKIQTNTYTLSSTILDAEHTFQIIDRNSNIRGKSQTRNEMFNFHGSWYSTLQEYVNKFINIFILSTLGLILLLICIWCIIRYSKNNTTFHRIQDWYDIQMQTLTNLWNSHTTTPAPVPTNAV